MGNADLLSLVSPSCNTTNINPNMDASNWILAILTFVLVLVTTYYAWETRKIRKEAEKMREIANKPIFSLEISDSSCSENPAVTASLYLINYGPFARDIHINVVSEFNQNVRNERERYLIAMGTNQKIELLGDYCEVKRQRGKIIVNITFCDVNLKFYNADKPLKIDFNENAENFLTIPYDIETRDRLAIIAALNNLRR